MLAHFLLPRVMVGALQETRPPADDATLSVDIGGPYEEGQTVVVTVSRAGSVFPACSADVELVGMPEAWLVGPATKRVELPIGARTATASFPTQVVIGDQGDFTVTARLANVVGASIASGAGSATFAISDTTQPTDPPTLTIARASTTPATVTEGETARFVVTASYSGLTTPATVAWAVTSSGSDADTVAPRSGTVSVGGTSATANIDILTAARAGVQVDRTLTVTLSGPTGATIATATATVGLRDAAPGTVTAWWDAVPLRTTADTREFRAGPMNFNKSAGTYETNVAPMELLQCDVVGMENLDTWDQVSGGPVPTGGYAAITSLSNAVKQAKWSSSEMGADGIPSLDAASKNKCFLVAIMGTVPGGAGFTETVGGYTRPKLTLYEDIEDGLHDARYQCLGKRVRLNMIAYGWDLNKLIIRWDKEGNRPGSYGMPGNMGTASVRATWKAAMKKVKDNFNIGYANGEALTASNTPRHYWGMARNARGDVGGAYSSLDIQAPGLWDLREVSFHPGKEMTDGQSLPANPTEEQIKAKIEARFDLLWNGDINGIDFRTVIAQCVTDKVPLIIGECDPSHGASGNVCWYPDLAGARMLEKFNAAQRTLAAEGLCFMHCVFDEKSIFTQTGLGFWGTYQGGTEAYIRDNNFGVPTWYPGYTSAKPIPAANWALIKAEYLKRWNAWVDLFCTKWGN